MHEEAGGLNWKLAAVEIDGIECQPDIAPVMFQLGRMRGLHTADYADTSRQQSRTLHPYGLVDHRPESLAFRGII